MTDAEKIKELIKEFDKAVAQGDAHYLWDFFYSNWDEFADLTFHYIEDTEDFLSTLSDGK